MDEYDEEIRKLKEKINILEEKRLKIDENKINIEEKKYFEEEEIRKQKEVEEKMKLDKEKIFEIIKNNKYDKESEKIILNSINNIIDDNFKLVHKDLIKEIFELVKKIPYNSNCSKCQQDAQREWNIYCEQQKSMKEKVDLNFKQSCLKSCLDCVGYELNKDYILRKLLKNKIIDIKYEIVLIMNQSYQVGIINYYDIFGNLYRNKFDITRKNSNDEYQLQIFDYNNLYYDDNLFNEPFTYKYKSDKNIDFYQIVMKYGSKEDIIQLSKIKENLVEKIEKEKKKLEEEILKRELLEARKRIEESDRIIERFLEEKEQKRKDEESEKTLQETNNYFQSSYENNSYNEYENLDYQIQQEREEEEYIRKEEADRRCRNAGYKDEKDWHARNGWAKK
jgi:hypothetical protein